MKNSAWDLKTVRGFGSGIVVHRHIVDPERPAPVGPAKEKAGLGHQRHPQHARSPGRQVLCAGIGAEQKVARCIHPRVNLRGRPAANTASAGGSDQQE